MRRLVGEGKSGGMFCRNLDSGVRRVVLVLSCLRTRMGMEMRMLERTMRVQKQGCGIHEQRVHLRMGMRDCLAIVVQDMWTLIESSEGGFDGVIIYTEA